MTGAKVGYIRVSTKDQTSERQLYGLTLDKVFEDKTSGNALDRPGFKACYEYLRQGDTLYVHDLDRLGRSLNDIENVVRDLTGKGITVHFVQEKLSFSNDDNPMGMLQLQLLGAFAEFERRRIKRRQKEGIETAKKRGVRMGRKPALSEAAIKEILARYKAGESKSALARAFGVSIPTLYRAIPASVFESNDE